VVEELEQVDAAEVLLARMRPSPSDVIAKKGLVLDAPQLVAVARS
jgi:hypothetical protein